MYEFLLVFGVVLWLMVGAFYVRQPAASMYHPLTYYMLVHGFVFMFRPIVAYHYDFVAIYRFYQFLPSLEEKATVLGIADLALIVFSFTSLKFGNLPLLYSYNAARVIDKINAKYFLIVCIICLPVSIYSLASTLRGTANVMAMDVATGVVYNISGNGYFYDAQLMTGPICVIFAWIFRFKIWAYFPFLGYLAAKAATGGRGPFIQAFIAICLLYFFDRRKRWPSTRMVLPVLFVLFLFTIVGSSRSVVRDIFTGSEVASIQTNSEDRPLEGMDYGNMEYLEFIVHTIPNRTGTYGYFLDNLQVLTEPIPRALWHSKPLGAPIQMYDLFAYGNPIGMTPSIAGEGWAQAGWLGVIIWTALFGTFYGWLYNRFCQSRQTVAQIALYMTFMAASFVTYRDGGLLTIMKSSLFTLLPLALWGILIRLDRSPPLQPALPSALPRSSKQNVGSQQGRHAEPFN